MAYEISDGLTAGLNVSHDFQESDHFDTRVSTDLKVRFGDASTTAQRKAVQQLPVISALTSTPSNRDVRVHDAAFALPNTRPYCIRRLIKGCIKGYPDWV